MFDVIYHFSNNRKYLEENLNTVFAEKYVDLRIPEVGFLKLSSFFPLRNDGVYAGEQLLFLSAGEEEI
jgi:hypothetical protein